VKNRLVEGAHHSFSCIRVKRGNTVRQLFSQRDCTGPYDLLWLGRKYGTLAIPALKTETDF